jgi:hypothetical protein
MEIADPQRDHERKLKLLPNCMKFKTDAAEPSLANERRETEEPKFTKFKTESPLSPHVIVLPKTDNWLPNRLKLRKLRVLPQVT